MKDRPFETTDVLQGVQIRFLSCKADPKTKTIRIEFSFTSTNLKEISIGADINSVVDMDGNTYYPKGFNYDKYGNLTKGVERKGFDEILDVPSKVRYFKLLSLNFSVDVYRYTVQYKDVRISYPDEPRPAITQPKPEPQNTANTQNFMGEWRGELRGALYYNFNLFITSFEGNQFLGYYTDEEGRIVQRDIRGSVNGNKIQIQLDAIPVEGTLSGGVIKGTGKLATPGDLQLLLTKKLTKSSSEKTSNLSTYEYKGIIADKKTKTIPTNIVVFYEDLATGEILGQTDVDNLTGAFVLYLPYGKRYGISAKGEGFISASTNIDLTKSTTPPKTSVSELAITTINAGNAIVLNNIFFETGKAALLPESFLELNRIADFLKANPSIATEIAGHTDNVGTDAANQILSQDRANAVRYYLQSRGIQASRLVGKGYGKTQPIAPNTTEAGRQQNRRVEFVIVRK
ncbi:MAG: OmpA family protein [Runella sp.]